MGESRNRADALEKRAPVEIHRPILLAACVLAALQQHLHCFDAAGHHGVQQLRHAAPYRRLPRSPASPLIDTYAADWSASSHVFDHLGRGEIFPELLQAVVGTE